MADTRKTNTSYSRREFSPRYSIIEKLGEGGVAEVYRVRDLRDDSEKALKALKPEYIGNARAVERFEEEFRILRQLHHPSLPLVYDYGTTRDGMRFMVMEIVEGDTLDRFFIARPENLRLLLFEIVEALAFIHEHDLLHMDVKPGNLLVRMSGAYDTTEKPLVMLMDFGLSYRRDTGGKVSVVGTPAYMAPEIISGKARITRAVDYYSLGVTLYELLEGRTPFSGSTQEILRSHLSKDPTFTREKVEYAELYTHVRALMSKDVDERLEAFEDFRRMVGASVSGEKGTLEQAYGLGHMESLGVIGKADVWDKVMIWLGDISHEVVPGSSGDAHAGSRPETSSLELDKILPSSPSALLGGDSLDIGERLKRDLVPADSARVVAEEESRARDVVRTVVLTGAGGSGKTYLVDALRGECAIRGMDVWVLGEGGDYEYLMSAGLRDQSSSDKKSIADPRSVIIDRFVRGWNRLEEKGCSGGAMMLIDGFENMTQEEREFLEYVGKRIELLTDEGKEPGVFLVVAGTSPKLLKNVSDSLPKESKAEELVLPPPTSKDVEAVIDQFHGRMLGMGDRKRFEEYLEKFSESSGAMIGALKESLLKGHIERDGGKWRFVWSAAPSRSYQEQESDYYQILLSELPDPERKTLSWLSCHDRFLDIKDFLSVCGVEEGELYRVVESLKPYRLVELREGGDGGMIGIVNDRIAESLRGAMSREERRGIHKRYMEYFINEHLPLKDSYEILAFHAEHAGEVRLSLLMRVKVLRLLKQNLDVFGIRRICEDGIFVVRKLRGKPWSKRKWHLELYFIKQWVKAEWMISNYRGLIDVVKENIYKRKRELPANLYYEYVMSLILMGNYDVKDTTIKPFKLLGDKINTEMRVKISLTEAALLNNLGMYRESIKLLNDIYPFREMFEKRILCKMYIYYMLNYQYLGEIESFFSFREKLYEVSKERLYLDELLAADYAKIILHFNQSKYTLAKQGLLHSIRTANENKLYFRACSMYHLLSGVHYEEGNYKKALYYINRSLNLAADIGLEMWVNNCRLRLSFIYQAMGYFFNAINYAEIVVTTSVRHSWETDLFYGSIQLFYLYTYLGSKNALNYKGICETLSQRVSRANELALYHYTLGHYYYKDLNYKSAYYHYNKSAGYYRKIGFDDDQVRSFIKMAYICMESNNSNKFTDLKETIEAKINAMESKNLKAEYYLMLLAHKYFTRKNTNEIKKALKKCECIIGDVKNVEQLSAMHAQMFRANARLGNTSKAKIHFSCYYQMIKTLISNMRNQNYAQEYINSKEFFQIIREYRVLSQR